MDILSGRSGSAGEQGVRPFIRVPGLLLGFILLVSAELFAQISPGKLAAPHAEIEGIINCVECHELGGGPSAKKCLECHSEINLHLKARRGLHHKAVTVDGETCFTCHSEHAGRKFKLINWPDGQKNFKHEQAGFVLKGKHAQTDCEKCHKPEFIQVDLKKLQPKMDLHKTFLGLKDDCLACHGDEHRGQLGADCLKCHTEKAWKPAQKFDHAKTKFGLTGKHLSVDCAKCHKPVPAKPLEAGGRKFFLKFTGLQFATCGACHKDVHKGQFGAFCQSCHTTDGWHQMNKSSFDHSRTRFPLKGKHTGLDCKKCHVSGNVMQPLKFDTCGSCHKDAHKGKFGVNCASCHSESGWKLMGRINSGPKNFDHSRTGFVLRGRHQTVECTKCHTSGSMLTPLKSEKCSDCHKDAHAGQFAIRADGGRCESCHQEQGFVPANFGIGEHEKSRFPLVGSHMAAPCVACHKMVTTRGRQKVRQFVFASLACEVCHETPHAGQFSRGVQKKSCDTCHSPAAWNELKFIHDRDSRFRLEGAHRNVACEQCHVRVQVKSAIFTLYKPINPACATCHVQGQENKNIN